MYHFMIVTLYWAQHIRFLIVTTVQQILNSVWTDVSWLTAQPQEDQDSTNKPRWKQITTQSLYSPISKKFLHFFLMWIYSFRKITDH